MATTLAVSLLFLNFVLTTRDIKSEACFEIRCVTSNLNVE
jgi:hypothetical protein